MNDAQQIQQKLASEARVIDGEWARALHRVVRSMHDGHCPVCGYMAASEMFEVAPKVDFQRDKKCPQCGFSISVEEANAALAAFRPHLAKSVAIFEEWRTQRVLLPEEQLPEHMLGFTRDL